MPFLRIVTPSKVDTAKNYKHGLCIKLVPLRNLCLAQNFRNPGAAKFEGENTKLAFSKHVPQSMLNWFQTLLPKPYTLQPKATITQSVASKSTILARAAVKAVEASHQLMSSKSGILQNGNRSSTTRCRLKWPTIVSYLRLAPIKL